MVGLAMSSGRAKRRCGSRWCDSRPASARAKIKSCGMGVIRREADMESLTVLRKLIMSRSRTISRLHTLVSSVAESHILQPLRETFPKLKA